MTRRIALVAIPSALLLLLEGHAAAANPTYYDSLAEFQVDVTDTVTDDYSNPSYMFIQGNDQMSGVFGETDYMSTGHMDLNIISAGYYCAGCNGSFELSFLTTSVGDATGVNGVGFDIPSHSVNVPYYAFITFADGEQQDIPLPPAGQFWGVSAPERIERIHIGLSMGGSTTDGSFGIDNLIVGDGFDETPCGDGIPTEDEECDTAGESATCNANCTLPECGDGIPNEAAGEVCDDGGPSASCNADCTAIVCGDGIVNAVAGEECDDSGESATCNIDCTIAVCGDDIANVTAGEECDDSAESPACDPDCTVPVCGDGYENNTAGEFCDDGNLEDGDGCSATCTNEEIESTEGGGTSSEGGETTDASTTGGESSGGPSDTGDSTAGPADTTDGSGDSAPASETTAPAESSSGDVDDTSGGVTGATSDPVSGCGCTADPISNAIAWSGLVFAGAFATRRRRR